MQQWYNTCLTYEKWEGVIREFDEIGVDVDHGSHKLDSMMLAVVL